MCGWNQIHDLGLIDAQKKITDKKHISLQVRFSEKSQGISKANSVLSALTSIVHLACDGRSNLVNLAHYYSLQQITQSTPSYHILPRNKLGILLVLSNENKNSYFAKKKILEWDF